MIRKILIVFYFPALLGTAQENPTVKKYGAMIDSIQLKDNLTILASDALEGRYTGKRGQKMAAAFIAYHFREIGLEGPVNGSYYQTIKLSSIRQGDAYLVAAGVKHDNLTDFFYSGDEDTGGEVKTDVVFVGKGSDEDFAQVDVKGRSVMFWLDEFSMRSGGQVRALAAKARKLEARYTFVVVGTTESFDQGINLMKRFQAGEDLSLEKPDFQKATGRFYISPGVAEKILNVKLDKLKTAVTTDVSKKPLRKIKTGSVSLQVSQIVGEVETENVLGYLPGTDKKDELVVVTAHYDHIGKRSTGEGDLINNGADDDGSGTVAVMQLAKTFAKAKKDGVGPRRSMLFMTVTGEEEGLLGSEYYSINPVFPLTNTVVNLNIDMIGRVDDKYKGNKNYVYVIGADKLSSELHEINERMNNTYTHLTFDYLYNDEKHPDRFYYRSDHWNFARNNIPIIFYFNGTHPDYHRVSDEVDKIDFEALTIRTQAIFYTAWEVANREERLKVDKK